VVEIENPDALKRFFELMLSVLRIINSVVLSRGQQNNQTLSQAREFLTENRHSLVAVFKRNASIGGIEVNGAIDLNDLVDNYTLLISVTGFLEVSYISE
jgi:nuclear pore complex protein Nup205